MANRSQRRRRHIHRANTAPATAADVQQESHGYRMLASIAKSADSQQTRQKADLFTDLYDAGRAIPPPIPLTALLDLADCNAIHSGCIEAKVADSVGRGWQLIPEDDTEDGTDSDVDAVTRKMTDQLKTLCPKLPFKALIRQAVRELEKTGQGYIEVGREKDQIVALFPMPPQNMRATNDDDVFVQQVGDKRVFFMRYGAGPRPNVRGRVSAKTGKKDWGDTPVTVQDDDVANEVIVFQHYSERSAYYGIPPWVSGVPAIAELTAIREFNVSFFESGGQADRLIHAKGRDLEQAKKLAEDLIKQTDDSRGRAHVSLFTYGDEESQVDVHLLQGQEVGKRDSQFQQGRDGNAKELLIAHQVPGYRIGWAILGGLGGESAQEMLDAYRYGVIEPLQELVEGVLEQTLFNPNNGGLDLFPGYTFAFDELDWTSMQETIAKAESMVQHAMASPNQGRVMLGEKPSDDPRADLLYFNGVPLGTTAMGVAGDAAGAESEASSVLAQLRNVVRLAVQTHEQSQALQEDDDVVKSRWRLRRSRDIRPVADDVEVGAAS